MPKKMIIKTLNYLKEISILILGLTLSLLVSFWIYNHYEKRDMALYLYTIKIELENHLVSLDSIISQFHSEVNYSNYLRRTARNAIVPDSVIFYHRVIYDFTNNELSTDAFDMFQNSGMLRLINDNEFRMQLWGTYSLIKRTNIHWNRAMDVKIDEAIIELRNMDPMDPPISRLFTYYALSGIPQVKLTLTLHLRSVIEEMIKKFNNI